MGGSVSSTSGTPTTLDLRIYKRLLLAVSGLSFQRFPSLSNVRFRGKADIKTWSKPLK